jgi:hypothetical protein
MQFIFWWLGPVSGLIFFALYGFTEDARREYEAAFIWFRRVVLRQAVEKPPCAMITIR